jgi:hypothetical protein
MAMGVVVYRPEDTFDPSCSLYKANASSHKVLEGIFWRTATAAGDLWGDLVLV